MLTKLCDGAQMGIFGDIWCHILSATAEIRRGKKKKDRKKKTLQNYNGLPYYIGRPQKCG